MKKMPLLILAFLLLVGGCSDNPTTTSTTATDPDTTILDDSTSEDLPPPKPEIYEYSTVPYEFQTVTEYYSAVEGLSGWRLKNALYETIRGHTKVDYNGPKGMTYQQFYRELNEDILDSDNINFLYSGSCHKETPFDREHIWPKSLGLGGNDYAKYYSGSDVHNLYPALKSINSTRGNKEWDNNGTKTNDNLLGNKYGDGFFEPIDESKGEVARAILYMAVRYEGYELIDGLLSETPDLELNEQVGNAYTSGSKIAYLGNVKTLLEWNEQDPVDQGEVRRNELIYTKYQHNRNPFVDHPEYARMIFDPEYKGPKASAANPTSARDDLPLSLNSGIGSCIHGVVNTELFLGNFGNSNSVTTGYAGNINKTFTIDSYSLTMSAGLKTGNEFTLGTNGTSSPMDKLSDAFIRTGTTLGAYGSSVILNHNLSNIDGFKLRYANPTMSSVTSYHLFRSVDGGATFHLVSTWKGFDISLQKGSVFDAEGSAQFAVVISGNNPRLSIVSMTFYQNATIA